MFFFTLIVIEAPHDFEHAPNTDGLGAGQDNLLNQVTYWSCQGPKSIDDDIEVVGDRQAHLIGDNPPRMVTGSRGVNSLAGTDSNSIWLYSKPARDVGRCKCVAVDGEVGVLSDSHSDQSSKTSLER